MWKMHGPAFVWAHEIPQESFFFKLLCQLKQENSTAMDYVLVSLQHSCVAILVPHVMVLGGGAFSRSLGYKGGTHMNGIRALLKGTPESSHALFPLCEEIRSWQSTTRKGPSADPIPWTRQPLEL